MFHYSLEPDNENTRSELLRLAELTGRWDDVLRTEAQLFALTDDAAQKLLIARRAAALAEQKLGDKVRAFRGYLSALRLAPDDAEIGAQLMRLASAIESAAPTPPGRSAWSPWHDLARAYESLPAEEPLTRLLQVADVWARGAGEPGKALDVLERAALMDPGDPRLETALTALRRSPELSERLRALYLRLAAGTNDVPAGLRLRLESARLSEDQGDLDAAEPQYRAVLAVDPANRAAWGRLEHILRVGERWAELADHLERRAAQLSERLLGRERRQVLRELAALYESKLARPQDALSALGRLAEDEGADPELHAARARLYLGLGQLGPAIEALAEEARRGDRTRARAAHRRIADLCERELHLPERALEAYRALAELDPTDEEALSAQARLLESTERWKDLDALLKRRAARAAREARIELLRQRANLLEKQVGDPDGAASVLKELRALLPDDPDLCARLLDNLRKAGRAREQAALLAERVSAAEKRRAPAAEVATLLCQLGCVQADPLADLAGARKTLERALALAPEHPLALSELARLHLHSDDRAAYARVREREAELSKDPTRAVIMLLEAARVWREQAQENERARTCLERVLALEPRNWDALAGLLELAVEDKHWQAVHGLAERLLAVTPGPIERVQVLVVLARAARSRGALEEADRLVDQALALAPGTLPAIQERAELHLLAQRLDEAERVLNEALAAPIEPAQHAAPLWLLLGECRNRKGQLDQGYRAFLEADRLRPGHLPTRLAMGENRYQARQWREAALYLGQIGHPDAGEHADAVAQGYVHAAVAESRLRRPDKAAALFEAALCYKPDCAAALRALAELAASGGDHATAARYLDREARASGDPTLLERVGDSWAELGDRAAARRAYEEARDRWHAGAAEPTATLLSKLLELEREAGDLEAAWATASQHVAAAPTAGERAQRRGVAADIARARGDLEAARALWTQAVADDPTDEAALAALAEHGEPR
ncbi:MAG TPA: tetratricopeptide repeat protein, partial [Polyangia bacterium]|nr:tetratricopeptide repeat protein [Polyangia bacterium]